MAEIPVILDQNAFYSVIFRQADIKNRPFFSAAVTLHGHRSNLLRYVISELGY